MDHTWKRSKFWMSSDRLTEVLNKTVAMIYASEEDKAYRKRLRQNMLRREYDFLPRGHGRRWKKTKPEPVVAEVAVGRRKIKRPPVPKTIHTTTPLCDAVMCRGAMERMRMGSNKKKVRRKQAPRACVCSDLAEHFMNLKCTGFFYRPKIRLGELEMAA